jgi:glycerol uptake facilitator-like aquaporin
MQGVIRMFIGFMLVFGAVGTIEIDPDANLFTQVALAMIGLAIMFSGVVANKQQRNG